MWWLSIILLVFAGMCNAAMDVLRYRWNTSIFKDWKAQNWINPSIAWHNKWNIDQKLLGRESKLLDKIFSTTLVWVTDFWHFAKMCMLAAIMFAIVFYNPIINWWTDVLILYFSFTVTFELFFSKIFIRKVKS
jgi:hypothetical protein